MEDKNVGVIMVAERDKGGDAGVYKNSPRHIWIQKMMKRRRIGRERAAKGRVDINIEEAMTTKRLRERGDNNVDAA